LVRLATSLLHAAGRAERRCDAIVGNPEKCAVLPGLK
jgi:hypothetical protein